MDDITVQPKHKRRIGRKLLWVAGILLLILSVAAFYLYSNFNKLLSNALAKSFNSSIISDVYELKFKGLSVNVVTGTIQVHNVEFLPREKPLGDYPYINASLKLSTNKIMLSNVELMTLLKSNVLRLKSIEIIEPDIDFKLTGKKIILLPIRDSTASPTKSANTKNFIEAFLLKEFDLVNAAVHIDNAAYKRELHIKKLSISVKDLMIDQEPGKDLISNKLVDLSIGEITWRLKDQAVTYVNIKDYKISLDSLDVVNSPDTMIYHFADFSTGLKALDVQTSDSLFHLSMQSFNLSYRDQSITLNGISFKPNMSDAQMQKRFVYQTPVFSGSIGAIKLVGLNFDSLIFRDKLLVDEVVLDKLSVSIFKDQRKPLDKSKYPKYPGQQIGGINLPLLIKHLKASNVNLVNMERKPDGEIGKVNINRLSLDARNITTLPTQHPLSVTADAWIENKAHATLALQFSYTAPQFNINGKVDKFNLPDLNRFLKSYTPASIVTGTADHVSFSANAYQNYSAGTMTFLYHNLKADLDLKDKAKWKSDVLSFVGNTVVSASNPPSADKPAKVVQFRVDRDMNKGFINIIIKSILAGFKETMVMNKENRKSYREEKKQAKKDRKADKKGNKN